METREQRDRSWGRSFSGCDGSPTPRVRRRAVVAEQHPAVQAVLEHLLVCEGYEVWCPRKALEELLGPVLLLVGSEEGLHVLETRDVAGILAEALPGADLLHRFISRADGIRAYVPKPFGASDVLRVVWAVSGFDSRKRSPRKTHDAIKIGGGAATNWWVKAPGPDVEVRKSYTPPKEAYRMARKAGMDFVTLID